MLPWRDIWECKIGKHGDGKSNKEGFIGREMRKLYLKWRLNMPRYRRVNILRREIYELPSFSSYVRDITSS